MFEILVLSIFGLVAFAFVIAGFNIIMLSLSIQKSVALLQILRKFKNDDEYDSFLDLYGKRDIPDLPARFGDLRGTIYMLSDYFKYCKEVDEFTATYVRWVDVKYSN